MQWTEPVGKVLVIESRRGAGSATDRPYVMPPKTRLTPSTLSDAQDAARKIFHEAASAWPAVRRFHARKSKHFAVIERLEPSGFADLAAWLFLLENKGSLDHCIGFGADARRQLLLFSYGRLSESSDEGLVRLMDALRSKDFLLYDGAERCAILKSLVARATHAPLSPRLMSDVEALVVVDEPTVYSRVARVVERETRLHDELKSHLKELRRVQKQSTSGRRGGRTARA